MSDTADNALLVVEDHAETQVFLRMALSDEFSVDSATSADEAAQMARDNGYDLLLVDIALPGEMNGVDLVEHLRETAVYGNVPMIAMTAHQIREDRQYYLDHGFDDYLEKPFYPDDLLASIRRLLGVSGGASKSGRPPR